MVYERTTKGLLSLHAMTTTPVPVLGLLCICCVASQVAAFAVHQGCYITEKDSVKLFPFLASTSNSMTVESCRKLAKSRSVGTFALERGRDCRLDPINSSMAQWTSFGASTGGCDAPCTGDSRISCGGQQAANIYMESDAMPRPLPPNDYAALGCYKDDPDARLMTLVWVANTSMTLDLCANVAFSEQWLMFGVSGAECWAGQSASRVQALQVSIGCTTACPGNSTQACGGPLELSMFAHPKAPWLHSSDAASSSGSSGSSSGSSGSDAKAIVAGSCVGAAASSEACKGLVSAASAATAAHLAGLVAVVAAALLMH